MEDFISQVQDKFVSIRSMKPPLTEIWRGYCYVLCLPKKYQSLVFRLVDIKFSVNFSTKKRSRLIKTAVDMPKEMCNSKLHTLLNELLGRMSNQKNQQKNIQFSKFFTSIGELTDVISLIVHCPEDSTFLIAHDHKLDYHIPYIKATKQSWNLQVENFIKEYTGIIEKNAKLWRIIRFWRSNEEPCLLNIIYEVAVSLDSKKKSIIYKLNKVSSPSLQMLPYSCRHDCQAQRAGLYYQAGHGESFVNVVQPASYKECHNLNLEGSKRKEVRRVIDMTTNTMLLQPVLNRTKWITEDEFEQLYSSGSHGMCPDITALIPISYVSNKQMEIYQDCAIALNYNLIEVSREHVVVSGNRLNIYDKLLLSLPLSALDVICLHNEYLKFTYPNVIMGTTALSRFAQFVGWSECLYRTALRGADLSGKGGVTFKEFLYMICVVDPRSNFKESAIEARNRFIFRCFDMKKVNRLSVQEFYCMMQVWRTYRNSGSDSKLKIGEEIDQVMRAMNLQKGSDVSLNTFTRYFTTKFQQFQSILRSDQSILDLISNMRERTVFQSGGFKTGGSGNSNKMNLMKGRDFILSSYVSKINHGCVTEIVDIEKIDGVCMKELSKQLERTISHGMFQNKDSVHNEVLFYLKFFANDYPDQDQEDNMLESLRFKDPKKEWNQTKDRFSWGMVDFRHFAQLLIQVCAIVAKIFQSEKRMLILQGPMYIIGDVHGNIRDLCCFEREIWPMGVSMLPCSILFLGDYVDRGESGIEIIAYLFAQKVRSPQSIFLIRGNHEIRRTQKFLANYNTFHRECLRRCGNDLGKQLWEAVNDVFDCLPLAACVEGKIFCCHGGIPPPWLCPTIQAIQSIPCPLPSPDDNAIAWELLWNDPAKESELSDKVKVDMTYNEGFSSNLKRSTGHIFNEKAIDRFLEVNQLTHVIRAHESQKAGFQIHHNWKVMTVFSSSHYIGANKAACILVQSNGKIKIVQLNTDEYHAEKVKFSK